MHATSTMTSALALRVARTVRRHGLLAPGDCVLVAVSGGPDSVALLSLLAGWAPSRGFSVKAGHVNHGLRGEESEEDAAFVTALCEKLGIDCAVEQVPLGKTPSLQEQARERRYAALLRMADRMKANKVALGHTADDQAETLLMWMLRGAGAGGLAGIPPVRNSRFIRPMVEVSRAEVLAYLRGRGLSFRTDSSNATPLYLRNRIRHELLPILKRFSPGILAVLKRQADILREEHLYLNQVAAERLAGLRQPGSGSRDRSVTLDRQALVALPVALQRRVVQAVLREAAGRVRNPGFGAVESVLERVVAGRSGTSIVAGGVEVVRDYDRIRFRSLLCPSDRLQVEAASCLSVTVPSETLWPPTGQWIRLGWETNTPPAGPIARKQMPDRAVLDPATFTSELSLRAWHPGDKFQPLGMQGRHKKLQDFFADLKVPRDQRHRVPLLVAPEGIVWVVGYRADHRFAAGPGSARRLVAEVVGAPSAEEGS
jgi:tRNA(Ile)-lysidine synthase